MVLRLLIEIGIKLPLEMHKLIKNDNEPIAEADLYYYYKTCVFIDGPEKDTYTRNSKHLPRKGKNAERSDVWFGKESGLK